MNILVTVLLVVAFCYQTLGVEKVRYDGFKVYRLTPQSEEAVEALQDLEASESGYDFWTGVRGVGIPVDIMVPPHYKYRFSDVINSGDYNAEIFIPDVQKLIDNETPKVRKPRMGRALTWDDYSTLDEINAWLQSLPDLYPDVVTLLTVGKSHEGRDILGVKLSNSGGANEKRSVFIEANIHAREWITGAVATWILNELLTSDLPTIQALAQNYDWYIVPVFNPDGLVYTRTDRMWRKTRKPYFLCVGADPNRNWGYHFQDGGASLFPCSETYSGPEAFSEPSTKSISEWISNNVGPDLWAYFSIHSYSQLLLLPYGNSNEKVENYDQLYEIGLKAADSIYQTHGKNYTVGNIVDVLYVASGGSMDWVKGTFGTPITYTYELRDTGEFGFVLPPDQILPTAEETIASIITILEEFDQIA